MAKENFDIVVIGGGVTGTGTALDAASRGLSVALVEQRDYASGTSSRSSKLFHGGLRYLEQLNFRLVKEALRERNLMLNRLCPHLASPVSFLYPLQHRIWERAYVGSGVLLYDLLAATGNNPLPRHRHLSKSKALRRVPALRSEALAGAIVYWDAKVDDARHTMTLARTAAAHGAVLAPSTRVVDLKQAEGRVVGVRVADLESGGEFNIKASRVINTTGVWTDRIEAMAGDTGIDVRASKGIHLVVPRESIESDTGMILRTEKSVLFVIPWGRHWIVGTTDTDWKLDLAHPAASRGDIDYLLDHVNSVLGQPLTHNDIVGVYAGLRPLLAGESDATSKLSREHAVTEPVPGLISVAGGKYTSYRVMAADAVDAAVRGLEPAVLRSTTDRIPLVGAEGFTELWASRHQLVDKSPLAIEDIERMLGRYGSKIVDLFSLISDRPELAEPMPGAEGYLAVELLYAVTHEGALHLDDILTRRTRISIETRDRGVNAAEPTAVLLAEALGWDQPTVEREVEHYLARVSAELDSQSQVDDRTADAARLGAPDVRTGLKKPQ
ncbi:MAG: glycerol-3-phosphate dehydrogenase/oxidase [Acidimicrobiia bacterium]|nr:glycerol-3-phosphate dehydrogenase/oxidase [Acidimicrobiia bacterium]